MRMNRVIEVILICILALCEATTSGRFGIFIFVIPINLFDRTFSNAHRFAESNTVKGSNAKSDIYSFKLEANDIDTPSICSFF